jgi:hypothetical protein
MHLKDTHNSFETQCGSWAGFKLCKHLIELTGDARYGDWVERLVINGLSASIPPTSDGRVFYYSDYNPSGATKRNHETPWTCCTGTRPMAVADYHALVYFHNHDSLCVNLFTPSSVRWSLGDTTVGVRQRTQFPEGEEANFDVTLSRPADFALRLRCPVWLASPMQVSVNGQTVLAAADSENWVVIRRSWRDGDRLHVRLPMTLKSTRFQPDRAVPEALVKGPLVLALQTPDGRLPKRIIKDLLGSLSPEPNQPLHYLVQTAPSVRVSPFYELGERVPYFVALDPDASTRIGPGGIVFHPRWSDGGRFQFTNVVGATAMVEFEGSGIRWLGYRFDDGGRAEVKIDGKISSIVDQYGPGRELPFDWHVTELTPGKHSLMITLLPDKNAASRGRYLNLAGFEVTEGKP